MKQPKPGRFQPSVLLFCAALALAAWAAPDEPDLTDHPACSYCGMDRGIFAHSRLYIAYGDGSTTGVCSLHCGAVDLALKIDKIPHRIQVGDYSSHTLIDAESAFWVIGGDLPGVMTRRAKWAFVDKAAARRFVVEHGGELVDFSSCVRATFEDMYEDLEMIRKKRAKTKERGGTE